MKLPQFDIKTILLIGFMILSIIFGYKWYFGSNKDSDRIKEIEKEYKELIKREKESDARIKQWEEKFKELDIKDKDLLDKQIETERLITIQINNINKDKKELDELKRRMEETKKKIRDFKKNPPNRTGDDLINSIKNNTK